MTIKKTIKKTVVKAPQGGAEPAAAGAAPAPGGAAIADRFKLAPPPQQGPTVNKKAAMWALVAGLLSLAVSGILTYILYQHWEFLMPA